MGRRWVNGRMVSAALTVAIAASMANASCSGRAPVPPAPSAPASPVPTAQPSAPPTTSPSATGVPAPTVTEPSGPPTFPAGLRGRDVEVIPTTARVVALTFDAGANADGLASILTTLADARVPATFFLTGQFASSFPTSVGTIVAGGHRLANHTATHPHLPALSDAEIVNEMTRAESAIHAAGGTDPRPLFRFPFGDRDARTIAIVNGAGYVAVRWTVDTLGWKGTTGGITAQTVVDRVVGAARPGEIVLMHVGSNPDDHTTLDAQALPTLIARLRGMGYGFVTLDALLAAA